MFCLGASYKRFTGWRNLLMRMRTVRRRRWRKCCIYAFHGLLSALTGRKQTLLAIFLAGALFHWQESQHSLSPSLFLLWLLQCLKPEPALFLSPGNHTNTPWPPKMFIDVNWKNITKKIRFSFFYYHFAKVKEELFFPKKVFFSIKWSYKLQ